MDRAAGNRRSTFQSRAWGAALFGAIVVFPPSVTAQHAAHNSGTHAPAAPSAKAREQIATVAQSVSALNTSESLYGAGFRSVFGNIPTMGAHWVNVSRMLDSVKFLEPDQLLLGTVDGKPKVVGVAYAFLGKLSDAPDLFDGDQDAWHEHPELAPTGQSAVMLHVWFVPSPDGQFSGHNPWLPYWAAGVEPPADSVLSVPASASRARLLGLALAEAVEPFSLIAQVQSGRSSLEMAIAQVQGETPTVTSDSMLPPDIRVRRDSLRAAIPRLNAARKAGDQAAWDREADTTIAVWTRIRDAYLATLPSPRREAIAAFYKEMETGHAH